MEVETSPSSRPPGGNASPSSQPPGGFSNLQSSTNTSSQLSERPSKLQSSSTFNQIDMETSSNSTPPSERPSQVQGTSTLNHKQINQISNAHTASAAIEQAFSKTNTKNSSKNSSPQSSSARVIQKETEYSLQQIDKINNDNFYQLTIDLDQWSIKLPEASIINELGKAAADKARMLGRSTCFLDFSKEIVHQTRVYSSLNGGQFKQALVLTFKTKPVYDLVRDLGKLKYNSNELPLNGPLREIQPKNKQMILVCNGLLPELYRPFIKLLRSYVVFKDENVTCSTFGNMSIILDQVKSLPAHDFQLSRSNGLLTVNIKWRIKGLTYAEISKLTAEQVPNPTNDMNDSESDNNDDWGSFRKFARSKVDDAVIKCWHCLRLGHHKKDCPDMFLDDSNKMVKFCHNCGKLGHLANNCYQPRRCLACKSDQHAMGDARCDISDIKKPGAYLNMVKKHVKAPLKNTKGLKTKINQSNNVNTVSKPSTSLTVLKPSTSLKQSDNSISNSQISLKNSSNKVNTTSSNVQISNFNFNEKFPNVTSIDLTEDDNKGAEQGTGTAVGKIPVKKNNFAYTDRRFDKDGNWIDSPPRDYDPSTHNPLTGKRIKKRKSRLSHQENNNPEYWKQAKHQPLRHAISGFVGVKFSDKNRYESLSMPDEESKTLAKKSKIAQVSPKQTLTTEKKKKKPSSASTSNPPKSHPPKSNDATSAVKKSRKLSGQTNNPKTANSIVSNPKQRPVGTTQGKLTDNDPFPVGVEQVKPPIEYGDDWDDDEFEDLVHQELDIDKAGELKPNDVWCFDFNDNQLGENGEPLVTVLRKTGEDKDLNIQPNTASENGAPNENNKDNDNRNNNNKFSTEVNNDKNETNKEGTEAVNGNSASQTSNNNDIDQDNNKPPENEAPVIADPNIVKNQEKSTNQPIQPAKSSVTLGNILDNLDSINKSTSRAHQVKMNREIDELTVMMSNNCSTDDNSEDKSNSVGSKSRSKSESDLVESSTRADDGVVAARDGVDDEKLLSAGGISRSESNISAATQVEKILSVPPSVPVPVELTERTQLPFSAPSTPKLSPKSASAGTTVAQEIDKANLEVEKLRKARGIDTTPKPINKHHSRLQSSLNRKQLKFNEKQVNSQYTSFQSPLAPTVHPLGRPSYGNESMESRSQDNLSVLEGMKVMAEVGSPQLLGNLAMAGSTAYDNYLARSSLHAQQIQDPFSLISQISDSLKGNSQTQSPATSCPSPAVTRNRAATQNLHIASLWGNQKVKSSQNETSGDLNASHQK